MGDLGSPRRFFRVIPIQFIWGHLQLVEYKMSAQFKSLTLGIKIQGGFKKRRVVKILKNL